MKRTTYIIIGLLVSGLILMIVIIVFIAKVGKQPGQDAISLEGERLSKKLDGVRAVKMFVNFEEGEKIRYSLASAIEVTSSAVGEGSISFPKNEYLRIYQVNDILLVELDFKTNAIPERYKWGEMLLLFGLDLKLEVDSTLKQIVTEFDNATLNLKNMKSDSLVVCPRYESIVLDSCQFRSFDIAGGGNLYVNNSEIENFYVNLDKTGYWTFENSKVGTEFLSGSGSHYNTLQKDECDRVVWTPRTEEAELHLNFREKVVITIPRQDK